MLTPRLTECLECADISALLSEIDCKLTDLAKAEYNNLVFSLNRPIQGILISDLLIYKRILINRLCNPDYACTYPLNQIASRVKTLHPIQCKPNCQENDFRFFNPVSNVYPPTTIPPPSTTTTSSSSSTTTTSSSTSTTSSTTTLSPSQCCPELINISSPGQSFVANGVTIAVSSTDPSKLFHGNGSRYITPACLPPYYDNTLAMGNSHTNSTTADFTLTFSQPVNNIKIRVVNYSAFWSVLYNTLDYQEEFTFTTNSNPLSIESCSSCYAVIAGNKLKGFLDPPNGIDIMNGSGVFVISDIVPFTSLRIDGAVLGINTRNTNLGTFFELCDFDKF